MYNPTKSEQQEMKAVVRALEAAGWEKVCGVMDDQGTGGSLYLLVDEKARTSQRFVLSYNTLSEAYRLLGK